MKLTRARRDLLAWIVRCEGKLQLLQITASGGRGYSMLTELRRAGYAVILDHPTVKDRGGYPAQGVAATEAGRAALSEALGGKP